MQLTIKSEDLREGLNKILTVVDKKSSRPILTNCLLTSEKPNKLTLIASDLEVSAKIHIDAQIERGGSFCISSRSFFDILREMPSDNVNLSVDSEENYLKLSCKKINYSLLITNSEEYPQLTFENNNNEFKLRTKEVLNIINKTSHAISTDETRLYLNGIYLQLIDEKLRAVSIDGHRLALLETTEFLGDCKALEDGIIIPRKGINELKKVSEAYPDKELTLSVDESFLYIKAENEYFLSIRLIAREYPKYQTVIPSKTSFTMKVDKASLYNAVKRIKILSNEKTNGVKATFTENSLEVSAHHPSLGQAKEVIPVDYAGDNMEIGFNAKYLLDTLSVFDEGDICFEFNNELSPVVVKSEALNEFLGIIMPLKL